MAQKTDTATTDAHAGGSVLLTRFSAIGDVAMTVPVIYSVCRAYPATRFVMVTRSRLTDIFVNPPENLTLVGVDLKNDYRGIPGLRRLCRELKEKYGTEIYIDLHDVLRTKIMRAIMKISGVRTFHIVKPRGERKKLTRQGSKIMVPVKTQLEQYREVFAKAGFGASDTFSGLFAGSDAETEKHEGEKWIGIAPFAAHQGKIYPLEKMRKVVELLAAVPGNRIFFFGGGESEEAVLNAWVAEIPNTASLAGSRMGFHKELAFMSGLNAMLCMDSANMHLAAIAGTPTVSIWGATHPYCGFGPWHQPESSYVQAPVVCRPCSVFGNKPCLRGDYMCLNAIAPELVARYVMETIAKQSNDER